MSFESFADFIAMGTHGPYVWAAYGLSILILLINVVMPMIARRTYLKDEARRMRRESSK